MIDVLKQRKFGLWRNNSRFGRWKLTVYHGLVVNWELAKKIVINWYLAKKFVWLTENWVPPLAPSYLDPRSPIPKLHLDFPRPTLLWRIPRISRLFTEAWRTSAYCLFFYTPFPPRDVMEKLQEPGGMFQDHFYACLLLLVWRTVWTRLYAGTKFSSPVYSQKMTCILLHSSF